MRNLGIRFIFVLVISVAFFTTAGAQQNLDDLPHLPGRIVLVGSDYNVYNLDLEEDTLFQLTDDATSSRRYQWPTWSVDGRIGYFCCDPQTSGTINAEVYISEGGRERGASVYRNATQVPIYGYWSPQTCEDDAGCMDFAVLMNDAEGFTIALENFRNFEDLTISNTIGTGSPYYYSWSPDGKQLAFHRNNRFIEIYDVETREIIETYEQGSPLFQAPAWSPVDDRILFGTTGDSNVESDLIVVANGRFQPLVSGLVGQLSFAWSPDGNYIAYRAFAGLESELFVVDAITGEVVSRSGVNGVLAFFWSPDSRKIAYLTPATLPGSFTTEANPQPTTVSFAQEDSGLAWSVLNVETGENQRYSAFFPTGEMVYLLLYFDQFSQSHRVWAPDSEHIVYSEVTTESGGPRAIVSVLNVVQSDSIPVTVSDGVFAAWSFD